MLKYTEKQMVALVLSMTFVFIVLLGFIGGISASVTKFDCLVSMRKEAIRAGVGYYVPTEDGEVTFHWKTNTLNHVENP